MAQLHRNGDPGRPVSSSVPTTQGLPPLELLAIGAVKPAGWILEQMRGDLRDGLKGSFPRITANVTRRLFATQDRKAGSWVPGARGRNEKAWWAGEHEGYWIDSIARSAILTGDDHWSDYVETWVSEVLAAYDESGYIGIYSEDTRFPARGFDGELWTQSRAFQALLAWYEHTGNRRILDAVAGTVRRTIDHYRKDTYFGRPDPDGGVTHGVGYIDTLEWLHRITRDDYFADAAIWLYRDYSNHAPDTFKDLTIPHMRDVEMPWHDHGAHVGEAIHMPAIAAWFSGSREIAEAADAVLAKLGRHTNPAGGLAIGFLEAVAAAHGGGHVLNENCAHIEAMMSLNRLHAFRPSVEIGDWRERCIFNVVQGARMHPVDRAVSYLSRDNRLHACDAEAHGGRELFSPCHEAAACCVLNVPRAMPYYLEGMWYRLTDRPGLYCAGYGPSVLETEVAGAHIRVEQQTGYPFSDSVTFGIELERPSRFELVFRIPEGGSLVDFDAPGRTVMERTDRSIRFTGEWHTGDRIELDFNFTVERRVQADGKEAYWCWGPLVFALPFPADREARTEVSAAVGTTSGFCEYLIRPLSTTGWDYLTGVDTSFELVEIEGDCQHPWVKPPIALEGRLYDRSWNPVDVRLLPMGTSMLRRTTFPFHFLVPADPGTNEKIGVTADDDPMRAF